MTLSNLKAEKLEIWENKYLKVKELFVFSKKFYDILFQFKIRTRINCEYMPDNTK